MENISSEQELKQLLDDGRITEEEYKELLEAIRQKETVQKPVQVSKQPIEPKRHTGYGKAALILFILSILLPLSTVIVKIVIGLSGASWGRLTLMIGPSILMGLLCAVLAFVFGIIGWKSAPGKVAVIGVPCMGLMISPGLILLSLFSYSKEVTVSQPAIFSPADAHLNSYKAYPLDSLDGLISEGTAVIDEDVFVNGGGSLRIKSDSPEEQRIRLIETGPMSIENKMLIYSAMLRTGDLDGKAYLEMWCDIPGQGEFFSRGVDRPVTGTTEWTDVRTPFRLESGQMPANVKLNLVIEGTGTVWIDDIKLLLSPLN